MREQQSSTKESDKLREPGRATKEMVGSILNAFQVRTEKHSEMRKAATKFCSEMNSSNSPARWLSLIGPSGTGKTMLSRLVVKFFMRNLSHLTDENRSDATARFVRNGGLLSWPRCIEWMLDGDFGFHRQACDDWLLVLDDIGAENSKLADLSLSKLYTILTARQDKWTILTCNYTMDQIAERLDPRIASRLIRHGGVVVDTSGEKDFNLL